MRKADEYKQNAKHCRALAALMTRPEDRVTLEEVAEAWERVAALAERDPHEASVIARDSAHRASEDKQGERE
jgi:alkanesulfonate monooxygenase SsuD/methylene tetrahydromethanopterin reductase-like flavin-dependent oxidoreductase (luciferase family)